MTLLGPHLAVFLREHLPRDRRASPHTCEAYATSFRFLVVFAARRLRTKPAALAVEQIDAELILAFLEHLEVERGNGARSRNARLAAINAFFRFLQYRLPDCLDQAGRIHAIPIKKTDEALVTHLTRVEMKALLDAPDPRTRSGTRDRAMLHLAFAAGLRVSELVGLRLDQLDQRNWASIHVMGKGRRERVLPLWKETASALKAWIAIRPSTDEPEIFLNSVGRAMTRSGFERILAKHVRNAAAAQSSLVEKRVTPHVLRHTCDAHTSGHPRRQEGLPLARPRHPPEHRDQPARRSHREARSPRRDGATAAQARPLQRARQGARHAQRRAERTEIC